MVQASFSMRRSIAILCAALVVVGCASATPSPSPQSSGGPAPSAPASGAPAAGRLIAALTPPSVDSLLPWMGGHSMQIQIEPALESLIGIDQATGEFIPMLATDWEMAPDGRSWTVNLRQGVNFHYDFGEFTARDVVKSWELLAGEDSVSSNTAIWQDGVERVEAVNDYQVIFHLANVNPEFDFYISSAADLKMMSTAQFEAEGVEDMGRRLAGTGPYRITEFNLGQSVIFEKAPEHEWRIPNPAFQEIEFRFVREDTTRLAMLASNEAQLAVLPRDLLTQATEQNEMAEVAGSIGGTPTWLQFGGLHFTTGDAAFNPDAAPWTDPGESGKLVRQAIAKAINRDEINEFLLGGTGDPMALLPFHPTLPGWTEEWGERHAELYGYDPDAARALLAEAGYPDGFTLKMYRSPALEGAPELPQIAEAIALDLGDVGLTVELEEADFSVIRENYINKTNGEYIFPLRSNLRPIQGQIQSFFTPERNLHMYETDSVYSAYKQLTETVDPGERDALANQIGDELFDNFATVPLFYLKAQLAYNPEAITGIVYSGIDAPIYSNFAAIEAAQ